MIITYLSDQRRVRTAVDRSDSEYRELSRSQRLDESRLVSGVSPASWVRHAEEFSACSLGGVLAADEVELLAMARVRDLSRYVSQALMGLVARRWARRRLETNKGS